MKLPNTVPVLATEAATPTVAAPVPINLAAVSVSQGLQNCLQGLSHRSHEVLQKTVDMRTVGANHLETPAALAILPGPLK